MKDIKNNDQNLELNFQGKNSVSASEKLFNEERNFDDFDSSFSDDLFERNKVERKGKTKKRSFYVALFICTLAVTAAGWSTYQSVKDYISSSEKNQEQPKISDSSPEIKKTKKKKENQILDPTPKPDNAKLIPYEKIEIPPEAAPVNTQVSKVVCYPAGKNITKEFSGDKLVFSETLKDMRVHQGVDFEAAPGVTVKSVASGVVKDVYKDQSYGQTVIIEHDTGEEKFTAYYSGLGENILVQKDQKVNPDQEIGTAGKVPCEVAEKPHIHFAIMKDEKFIDPILILNQEKDED